MIKSKASEFSEYLKENYPANNYSVSFRKPLFGIGINDVNYRISPRIEKYKRLKGKIYFSVAIGLYGPLSGNYTKKESTAARQSSLFSGQYVTIPILEAISTLRMPSSINNVSDGIIPLSLSMNSNISLLGLVIPTS